MIEALIQKDIELEELKQNAAQSSSNDFNCVDFSENTEIYVEVSTPDGKDDPQDEETQLKKGEKAASG